VITPLENFALPGITSADAHVYPCPNTVGEPDPADDTNLRLVIIMFRKNI